MQPNAPPQQPPRPAPQQPWPQPQYPYPPPPPKSGAGKTIAIVVVVLIIVVVVVIAVAAILLASLNPFLPGNSFSAVVSHGADNNWTVVVITVPPGLHPSDVTLTIRDPTGGATNVTRVALSFLIPSTWASYHVVYEAANPLTSDISTGDQLQISELVYPQGCVITIEDSGGGPVLPLPLQPLGARGSRCAASPRETRKVTAIRRQPAGRGTPGGRGER